MTTTYTAAMMPVLYFIAFHDDAYLNASVPSAPMLPDELCAQCGYESFESARDALAEYLREEHANFYPPDSIKFSEAQQWANAAALMVSHWQARESSIMVFEGTDAPARFAIEQFTPDSIPGAAVARSACDAMRELLALNKINIPIRYTSTTSYPTGRMANICVVANSDNAAPDYWVYNGRYSQVYNTVDDALAAVRKIAK